MYLGIVTVKSARKACSADFQVIYLFTFFFIYSFI